MIQKKASVAWVPSIPTQRGYYIKQIHKDCGEQAYLAAVEATQQRLTYYNSLGYGKHKSIERRLKELVE